MQYDSSEKMSLEMEFQIVKFNCRCKIIRLPTLYVIQDGIISVHNKCIL